MRKFIILTVLLFGTYLFAQQTKFYETSFSCEKVKKSSIEYKICTDKELAKLDTILNKTYKSFRLITKEIKQDQRAWIKKRNRCKTKECIKDSYLQRVDELLVSLNNEKTFPQYVIDAMKTAETKMKLKWNPIIFDKQRFIDAGLKFKNELFHYKNISFKSPLVENVQYDDQKLKKILGVCWYYRFDLKIEEFHNPKYIENGRRYFVEDERKPLNDINVSVWKTTSHDKKWFFIKLVNGGYAYLVNTALCKQKRLKNNLVDALNYNREQVKRSQSGLDNVGIVSYKKHEYIFDVSWVKNSIIYFDLYRLLSETGQDDPTIRFTGGLVYLIPYEQIIKSQTGEK